MKRIFNITALILVLSLMCACTAETAGFMTYDSKQYVKLCDYDNLQVAKTYLEVTDDDINNIVEMEMSSNEAYVEITNRNTVNDDDIVLLNINGNPEYYNLGSEAYGESYDNKVLSSQKGSKFTETIENEKVNVEVIGIYRYATVEDEDFVLDFYGYKDYSQLKAFLEKRAQNEILYNYALEYIEDNSKIKKYPTEISAQAENTIKEYKANIEEASMTFDEYCEQNEITEEEFEQNIKADYNSLMIYKAILDNENIKISDEEIAEYIEQSGDDDRYMAYFTLAESKLKTILPSKVKVE